MERLTERIDNVPDGESGVWVKQHDYISAAEKLADYEDAEEQGLLLRLKCKTGDDVSSFEELIANARNKAIDDFVKALQEKIEKDLANPDLALECKKCGIWKNYDIKEIAEQLKTGGK